jgi:hypothetical protein
MLRVSTAPVRGRDALKLDLVSPHTQSHTRRLDFQRMYAAQAKHREWASELLPSKHEPGQGLEEAPRAVCAAPERDRHESERV